MRDVVPHCGESDLGVTLSCNGNEDEAARRNSGEFISGAAARDLTVPDVGSEEGLRCSDRPRSDFRVEQGSE